MSKPRGRPPSNWWQIPADDAKRRAYDEYIRDLTEAWRSPPITQGGVAEETPENLERGPVPDKPLNPVDIAARFAGVLIELWLGGVPLAEIIPLLWPLSRDAERLIVGCWSKRGNERRSYVPPKIREKLCRLAIEHVVKLGYKKPDIKRVMRLVRQAAPEITLRRAEGRPKITQGKSFRTK